MNLVQQQEQQEKLKNALENQFKISFTSSVPNIDSPLLLVLDYSPTDENINLVSFGFSLSKYYEGNDRDFENRFWTTRKTRNPEREIENTPHFCQEYKEFNYEGKHFYPFSASLNEYSFINLNKLLSDLYNNIDFT